MTSTDSSYAADVAGLLWPEPWSAPQVVRRRAHRGEVRDAYVLPSLGRPRVLVPADVPGAAVMVRRLGSGHSVASGPARRALELALRSRVLAAVRWPVLRVTSSAVNRESVETHLGERLGTDVRVGVILGTRRVNQKPVLQVFDRSGHVLGFAKIGHNPLTADLVRREAASLQAVRDAGPRSFGVPEVLAHDTWAGLEVLLLSPLVTDPDLPVPASLRLEAMREVSRLTGSAERTVAGSGFWTRLRADADRLSDTAPGAGLASAVLAVEDRHGGETIELGAWHGDWGHWNQGLGDDGLLIWDWERFDAEVPVGFDALHHAAQLVRPGERDAGRQESDFLAATPRLLDDLGVPSARHALTLRLYLLEIAVRYADALTHGATPALTRRTAWVHALLERQLAAPHPALLEGRP